MSLTGWLLVVTASAVGVLLSGVALAYTLTTSTPETVSQSIIMMETAGIYVFGAVAIIGMIISTGEMSKENEKLMTEITDKLAGINNKLKEKK